MAITDLTGTKWIINSSLSSGSFMLEHLNFTSNGETFSGIWNRLEVPLQSARTLSYLSNDSSTSVYSVSNGWSNEAYRTIEITGGTDVTNSTLISWLEQNAEYQPPQPVPTNKISLGNLPISKILLGNYKVNSIFLGNIEIYSYVPITYDIKVNMTNGTYLCPSKVDENSSVEINLSTESDYVLPFNIPIIKETNNKYRRKENKIILENVNHNTDVTVDCLSKNEIENNFLIPTTQFLAEDDNCIREGDYLSNIWHFNNNTYYSYGPVTYKLNKNTSSLLFYGSVYNPPPSYIYGENIWSDGINVYYSRSSGTQYKVQLVLDFEKNEFKNKSWSGLTDFDGQNIWTDGNNIYYSYNSNNYVLDKLTDTWNVKTWNGLTSLSGREVWTDGENIYYSSQYVLDKSTSTWNTKTWNGYTSFTGRNIWTDGENIYYSNGTNQYILYKSTSTWESKIWNGLTSFKGSYIWNDEDNDIYVSTAANGTYKLNKETSTWEKQSVFTYQPGVKSNIWTQDDNIYYSSGKTQLQFDESTLTWKKKTWNGLTSFNGSCIWKDGNNIYYSSYRTHYILNKETSTWESKTWNELTNFSGTDILTDGENIYCSILRGKNYILNKETSTWELKTWSGYDGVDFVEGSDFGKYTWTDGENIYYSEYVKYANKTVNNQYMLNTSTDTWEVMSWTGMNADKNMWTDSLDNVYCVIDNVCYIFNKQNKTWDTIDLDLNFILNPTYIWKDNNNTYYTPLFNTESTYSTYYSNEVCFNSILNPYFKNL